MIVGTADGGDVFIRLLQFKPAWSLHCLLRFRNLPYLSENTGAKCSLGLHVPLLIDGNFLFANRLAIEHLSEDRKSRITNSAYGSNSVDNDSVHEQFLNANRLMSDHIEVALIMVYDQLLELIQNRSEKSSFGLSATTHAIGSLKSLLRKFDVSSDTFTEAERSYPECDEEDLLARLEIVYAELDTLMGKNKGFLISISVTAPTLVTASANVILGDKKTISRSRGAAEAVLFGHLADAISNPVVSEIIKKHENLVAFTRNVLEEYFLIPMRSPKANLRLSLWEDATQSILSNSFFRGMPASTITESLLSPICPSSPNGFADVNPLRMTITDRSYCSPRRNISQRSLTVTSPKRNTNSKSPPPPVYNFDRIGTEMTPQDIALQRLLGSSAIFDRHSEYCGRYIMVPHYFSRLFPHIEETAGHIRLTPKTSSSDFNLKNGVRVGEDSIFKEECLSDFPRGRTSTTPFESSVFDVNKDVEMSLLGTVFVAGVTSLLLANVVVGIF